MYGSFTKNMHSLHVEAVRGSYRSPSGENGVADRSLNFDARARALADAAARSTDAAIAGQLTELAAAYSAIARNGPEAIPAAVTVLLRQIITAHETR
jgi:hypothetical protein